MTRTEMQKWGDYDHLISGISELLETARRASVRAVNAVHTAMYWEIGRRIIEFEQAGKPRAGYGEELLARLSKDLTEKHGRGFRSQPAPDAGILPGLGDFGRHRLPNWRHGQNARHRRANVEVKNCRQCLPNLISMQLLPASLFPGPLMLACWR